MCPATASPPPHGTLEWAKHSLNIQDGCEHDCRYCYAKTMAIRFKRASAESWCSPRIRTDAVTKRYGKRDGRIMFPTAHDITERNVDDCISVLKRLLVVGNDVLIVSKPRVQVIARLCQALAQYRDQVVLRCSIGSACDTSLQYWEPYAPCFRERLDSLRHAHRAGYRTSVSGEPMLDGDAERLVELVRPYVTDSIWLGKANRLRQIIPRNCPTDSRAAEMMEQLIATQADESIHQLYRRYASDRLIRWKDSIKKVVGLARPSDAGMDI